MVICIDKATAIRMYDKVRKHWMKKIKELSLQLRRAPEEEWPGIKENIKLLEETDMAVIVSPRLRMKSTIWIKRPRYPSAPQKDG